MKAYVYKSKPKYAVINKEGHTCHGLKMAYLTKDGIPICALEDEEDPYPEYDRVAALAGMVCLGSKGDLIYLIDADHQAHPVNLKVIVGPSPITKQQEEITSD